MAGLSLAFDIIGRDKSGSKALNNVGDSAERAERKGAKFSAAMGAGLAVAGAAAVGFGRSSVSAFVESEQASNRLDQALAKFPKTADVSRESFDKLNASLAKKTKFDDDATASGQAVLAQFGLTGKQIQQMTPLLQDYAAKTGKDLPSAAQDLGKAVMGQGRALKAIGLDLKDTGSATGNLEQLMGGLRTQVGGFATAEGNTAAGRAAILKNQFGELQEQVGAKLVPALTAMAGGLLKVIDFTQRNASVIVPLVAAIGGFAAAVWAVNAAAKAYTAVQAALNIVMSMNPIGAIVLGVAALAAGLVLAYQKSETFRDIVNGAMGAVRSGVETMWGVVRGIFDALASAWSGIKTAFTTPIPFGSIFDGLKSAFKGAVNFILRKWNDLEFKIGGQKVFGIDMPGVTIGTPNIPLLAKGGPVRAGQPYIVGDGGRPELFVPRQDGYVHPDARKAAGPNVTIQLIPGSSESQALAARREMQNLWYVNGWA